MFALIQNFSSWTGGAGHSHIMRGAGAAMRHLVVRLRIDGGYFRFCQNPQMTNRENPGSSFEAVHRCDGGGSARHKSHVGSVDGLEEMSDVPLHWAPRLSAPTLAPAP